VNRQVLSYPHLHTGPEEIVMDEARNILIAVADAETTGPDMANDRIVEVAAVLLEVDLDSGQVLRRVRSYEGLQDPGIPIPPEVVGIHGITNEMVRGLAIDPAALSDVLRPADLVVAHWLEFDRAFVSQVLPGASGLPWACSSRGIPWKEVFPGLPSRGLQALATAFGVGSHTAHRPSSAAPTGSAGTTG
jgi:DNA polymerase-3 subunit epsilon